jgi:hypothetical protein
MSTGDRQWQMNNSLRLRKLSLERIFSFILESGSKALKIIIIYERHSTDVARKTDLCQLTASLFSLQTCDLSLAVVSLRR